MVERTASEASSKGHQTRSTRHQPQTRFDGGHQLGANNHNQLRVFGRRSQHPKHWLSVIGHGHGMNRERAVGGMLGQRIGVMGMTQSLESSRGTPPTLWSLPQGRAMVVTLWSIMPNGARPVRSPMASNKTTNLDGVRALAPQ